MNNEFGIILAGGIGARFGSSVPKQYMKLNGREIISYSIESFRESRLGENFILVCNEAEYKAQNIAKKYGVTCIQGGTTRNESIYNGLKYVQKYYPKTEKVVIHDGVRPVIDEALISGNIACAREKGNAISCAPATETVLLVDGSHEIRQIEDRSSCFHAKAPQTFRLDDIIACHRKAMADGMTSFIDSCSMMDHYGYRLHMVICSSDNIKVTTPKDYYLSKALLKFDSGIVDE